MISTETAKQWSGAALAGLALLGTILIALIRPEVLGKETIVGMITAFGLRGTALVAYAFGKIVTTGEDKTNGSV